MKWLEYIQVEQLSEDYKLVAQIIGLEQTVKLAQGLSTGVHLYLKNPDRLFQAAKEAYVRTVLAKHPGTDRRRLALETGLSERHVYDLAAELKEKAKQGSLFETAS